MYARTIKPALDRILAFLALMILLPFFLLLSAAIFLDDPGPVFFTQKRVGIRKNGKISYFQILKFRTMKCSTPHDIPTHLLENPEQYITRVGRILRKTSMDELPQLLNIAAGEMSFVGPRPALWNQFDLVEERDKYKANDVMPGWTGWAQINGRDELEIPVKARLDGEYVQRMSLWFDIRCLLGTIKAVVKEEGVKEGGTGAMEREAGQRTLIITNHSYMLWQFRRELISELLKKGEVVISTPFVGHEADFVAMGCELIETEMERRGTNPIQELILFRTYRQQIHEEKPDLVITYSIKPNIYAGLICQKMKIPYAANVQGLGTAFEQKGLARIAAILYKAALKKAKTVFFENEADAKSFVQMGILHSSQTTILHGAGVNLAHYAYRPYPSETEGIHILFVSRIMREKGVDELFAAIPVIKAVYGDNVIFDIVGFYEDDYKTAIEKMEKNGLIVFHGFQPDPRPFYTNSHAVVLPSYHEGMSNVLLEAAATGRAVITSDIPGCREAVEEGITGFLAAPKDTDALVKAINAFLSLSASERAYLGVQGRRKVKNEFNKTDVVQETIKALEK